MLPGVNFEAHCRNFRRTAENLRSTDCNVGSIYFKRKSKKLNSATFYFYFSPVIDKTQLICYAVIPLWFLMLISLFDSTVVTKENLHVKKNSKLATGNNECVKRE